MGWMARASGVVLPHSRTVEQHRSGHAEQSQAGSEGGRLPMTMGNCRPASLAAWRAATQADHLRGYRSLIDEDQLLGAENEGLVGASRPKSANG